MEILETKIAGLHILEDSKFTDHRGSFRRKYCSKELEDVIGEGKIVQVNQSDNLLAGTVRGLHYQVGVSREIKIVSCIGGSALDVAVDLRRGSKTFLQYETLLLTPESSLSFLIPEGFAHGFQTLEDNTSLIYLTTQFYSQDDERGINYLEPLVGIQWERPPAAISIKDHEIPFLSNTFKGI